MTPGDDELLRDRPQAEAPADPRWIDPQSEDPGPAAPPPAPSIDALQALDASNRNLLRPTLAALIAAGADRFDPVRFRFIQALAQKALQQRASVARMAEKKALHLLSGYLKAYLPAREHAASLVARVTTETPESADQIGRLFERGDFGAVERLAARAAVHQHDKTGVLAVLTREMLQRNGRDALTANPSLEDELRRQESTVIQSLASVMGGGTQGTGPDQVPGGSGALNAMRHLRQSLRKRHSEQRVTRAIQEGPENPGPLNDQALIVRSLSLMRDLSPSYTERFVSYMDTLVWLEKAGGSAIPGKPKGAGRRKT